MLYLANNGGVRLTGLDNVWLTGDRHTESKDEYPDELMAIAHLEDQWQESQRDREAEKWFGDRGFRVCRSYNVV